VPPFALSKEAMACFLPANFSETKGVNVGILNPRLDSMLLILIMAVNMLPIGVFMVKYSGEVAWFMTDEGEGIMIGFLMVSNILFASFSPFATLGILKLQKSLAQFPSQFLRR